MFILLFPVSRSPQSERISVYGGQRVGGGGGKEGTGESNYGLRLPDWQQIIFMSTQEDRKRTHDFFSPDFYCGNEQSPPRAHQPPVIHRLLVSTKDKLEQNIQMWVI